MPPKRKAPAAQKGKKGGGGKPAKLAKMDSVKANLAAAAKALKGKKQKRKNIQVDAHCPLAGHASVHEDWDCMLNQTNIGNNNNKYYVIQLLVNNGKYHVWNRWGRVGEPGQNQMHGPFQKVADAMVVYEKKYTDKTKNKWANRAKFQAVPGKYTLLEMGDEDEDESDDEPAPVQVSSKAVAGKSSARPTRICTLEKSLQQLVQLIFDNDMFKEQMSRMNLNINRLPLGKLSKQQIAKGFQALDEIDKALKGNKGSSLQDLSSKFYTIIPHDFGRTPPLVIDSRDKLRDKLDMLLVLGDIQEAQQMKRDQEAKEASSDVHPLDIKYESLQCELSRLNPKDADYKLIEEYIGNTGPQGSYKPKIINLYRMDRKGEEVRFSAHKSVKHRKLLWHGTSPAVVAAILKSGLRIMPHSGGRVGRGIYFASENDKSYGYTGSTGDHTGIMFLNEVVLGKPHEIQVGDSSLTKAPAGFDSVLAIGNQEPNPTADKKIKLGGAEVIVPVGKPKTTGKGKSHFYQSEYLVYKESQVRMRFLCELKMR